jgi:hypothetical protein
MGQGKILFFSFTILLFCDRLAPNERSGIKSETKEVRCDDEEA